MSRPLRLEHEGALWHITSRGNERHNIFRSDADRRMFLELFEKTVRRFRWLVRSWTLMTNHDHLVIGTPESTLSRSLPDGIGRGRDPEITVARGERAGAG